MKAIILFLALFSTAACGQERGWMVFGDSISIMAVGDAKASDVWPHKVQEFTEVHMQNMSKSGRFAASNEVADTLRLLDMRRNHDIKGIIIALGTNDGIQGWDFEAQMLDAIAEAQARNLAVICISPPDNVRADMTQARLTIQATCQYVFHAADWVTIEDMPDGLHLGKEGHRKYAFGLMQSLSFYEAFAQ